MKRPYFKPYMYAVGLTWPPAGDWPIWVNRIDDKVCNDPAIAEDIARQLEARAREGAVA